MPKFKTGIDVIKQNNSGGSKPARTSDFTKFFALKDGEEEFLHFIEGIDAVASIDLHRYVKVAWRKDDGSIAEGYRDFACRKMAAWEDGDNTCVICDGVGHVPKSNIAAVAVLLEPNYNSASSTKRISDIQSFNIKGNEYTTKDGNTIFYPEYVVVFQAAVNFWNQFLSHENEIGPINANPWKIIRDGADQTTMYNAYEVDKAEAVDFSGVTIPTIHEVLSNLGSKERYDTYFGDQALWRTQNQKYVNKDEVKNNSGVTRQGEDTAAEEDAETAFERIKRQAAAKS
jgi:hypothetical protein